MKQLVVLLTQHRTARIDATNPNRGNFEFRGGSTLIFDLEHDPPSLRYAVSKGIDDETRLADVRSYRTRKVEENLTLRQTYFGTNPAADSELDDEPLCLLHTEG